MNRRTKSLLAVGAATLLMVNVAFAVVVKVRQLPVPMPGIDAGGNITGDPALAGDGLAKLTLNTRTGRVAIVARGDVGNASGSRQKFFDVGLLAFIPGDIVRDDYTVARNGNAHYNGLARNVPF